MKRRFHILRREDGAELIEAALIYPFVLLVLTGLIYMGLFILQYITVGAYAQKVALLSAREVAYPGYISMFTEGKVDTSAVEVALNDYTKAASGDETKANGNVIVFSTDTKAVNARNYRYWSSDPLKPSLSEGEGATASRQYNSRSLLEDVMRTMVNQHTMLLGKQNAKIEITCQNYIIMQTVTVDVRQDLMNNQLLNALGVEQPSVHVCALASVNDEDEFIRTTDFICDAIKMIAKKLHLDVDDIAKKVNEVKKTLGLD
ncbi:MAG: hypothetical protein IK134_08675 [Oscillospiraceae bacterium]|nr:hypothetical protein [Oscillospiraceae bacterium]